MSNNCDRQEPVIDNWQNRSEGLRCITCMWYVPKCGELGRCRRHAPVLHGWPAVYETDWCGDHKIDEQRATLNKQCLITPEEYEKALQEADRDKEDAIALGLEQERRQAKPGRPYLSFEERDPEAREEWAKFKRAMNRLGIAEAWPEAGGNPQDVRRQRGMTEWTEKDCEEPAMPIYWAGKEEA